MSDTVIMPPTRRARRADALIPPLLIVPLIIYNIVAFVFYGGLAAPWAAPVFSVPMVSHASWAVSWGDLMLAAGLVFLFFEVIKSTRSTRASIVEHMLSTLVFVVFLVEFLLVGAAASSTFFLLMVMSLVDLVAGFSVSISSAGRDVNMN